LTQIYKSNYSSFYISQTEAKARDAGREKIKQKRKKFLIHFINLMSFKLTKKIDEKVSNHQLLSFAFGGFVEDAVPHRKVSYNAMRTPVQLIK
jgi:hypothetical protein